MIRCRWRAGHRPWSPKVTTGHGSAGLSWAILQDSSLQPAAQVFVAPLFAALGDETRLRLWRRLGDGGPSSATGLTRGGDQTSGHAAKGRAGRQHPPWPGKPVAPSAPASGRGAGPVRRPFARPGPSHQPVAGTGRRPTRRWVFTKPHALGDACAACLRRVACSDG